MAFDPCGTRKLEGEDILKRLAEYFQVPVEDLKTALKNAINEVQSNQK